MKHKLKQVMNISLLSVLSLILLLPMGTSALTQDLIKNGDFEIAGDTNWKDPSNIGVTDTVNHYSGSKALSIYPYTLGNKIYQDVFISLDIFQSFSFYIEMLNANTNWPDVMIGLTLVNSQTGVSTPAALTIPLSGSQWQKITLTRNDIDYSNTQGVRVLDYFDLITQVYMQFYIGGHFVIDLASMSLSNPISLSLSVPTGTLSGWTYFSASASTYGTANGETNHVTKVEFRIDGVLFRTDTTSAYTAKIDTTRYSNGYHTIQAKAYDSFGYYKTQSKTIYINNGGGGCLPIC